jgi:hypothetical protein
MVPVVSLWMPILLSAVLAFVASSIIHMATSWHKHDIGKLPNENGAMDAIRNLNLAPGDYGAPVPGSPGGMKSPEFLAKMEKGPKFFITVMPPGPMAMGRNLAQWFLFLVLVSIFTAYVTGLAHAPGTEYLRIFQVAGCVSFMGYGMASIPNSIWWSRGWGMTFRTLVDSLLYGLLTAGTFGWLWPR